MDNTTTTAMRSSLLARDVYCVCYPQRDGLDCLRGELSEARKKFFIGGKRAVKVGKEQIVKGFDGKLSGKLTRRNIYWKKTAGKQPVEESFELRNGYVVVRRDLRGVLTSRTYFDRDHRWVKSEYFEPQDPRCAQVIFKPVDTADLVERFDWEAEKKQYRSTELHPLPYLAGAAEQSILNARFGEPGFIVSTAEGEFCYCPKKEAQERLSALTDIKDGTIVLMPAWEVKEGALSGEEQEEAGLTFTSLEEYAKVEPDREKEPETVEPASPAPAGPPVSSDTAEFTPVTVPESAPGEQPEEPKAPEQEEEPEAAEPVPEETEEPEEEEPEQEETALTRPESQAARLTGRGRTEQKNGLTAYDGEYLDGRREGFGSYYDTNGNLTYAGLWKDDKKDGLGVSFRDTDHALHVTKWENGQPGGFVSLFDKDGNLRYGGRIVDGKKQGAGVSFRQEDGSIFVGQWEDGQPTGLGSSFDSEGHLLYYGGWKDGKRSGHGTEFDGKGGIVFDGEWRDGKYYNGILYQKMGQDAEDRE